MKAALITGKINIPELLPLFELLQEELSLLDISSFIIDPKEKKITAQEFQIVFSIGGDGNFVSAARKYVNFNVPIVAIKAGTVGFLPNIDPKDFKTELPKLFQKDTLWTRRMLLAGENSNTGQKLVALNEFLFSDENKGALCQFTVCINNTQVMHVRSDGLLTSTPTGSTAYNLSAGGPIALPDMNLINITPVCSHIIGERPFVVGTNNSIQIINSSKKDAKIWADGQDCIHFNTGDTFTISNTYHINSLYTSSTEFFNTLSQKLGWTSGVAKEHL